MKTWILCALRGQLVKAKQAEQKIMRSIRSTRKGKAFLAGAFLLAYGVFGSVHALTILAGSDYFRTIGGEFDFDSTNIPGIGDVDIDPFNVVAGGPFGPGNTDTVIARLENATLADDPTLFSFAIVPVQLSKLVLLQSAGPVMINAQDFNARVTLTPLPQLPGEQDGAFKIVHEFGEQPPFGGGVFDSTPIPVNLDVSFTPISGGLSVSIPPQQAKLQLSVPGDGSNHFWSTVPDPGAVIVTGKPGDLTANRHIPLDGLFDFFPDTFFSGVTIPWRVQVVAESGERIGSFELVSASAVPDEGPGVIAPFLLMGICIASQLWRTRLTRLSA